MYILDKTAKNISAEILLNLVLRAKYMTDNRIWKDYASKNKGFFLEVLKKNCPKKYQNLPYIYIYTPIYTMYF